MFGLANQVTLPYECDFATGDLKGDLFSAPSPHTLRFCKNKIQKHLVSVDRQFVDFL